MKKVAVVCAAGKEGRLLVDEAVSRGYDVTGFVRGSDKVANPKAKTVVKDLFDLTREDLIRFDAVIDAFGAWTPETLPLHKTSLKHLCDVLSGTKVRLLVVGGAGSLYVNPEHTVQVKDLESFPAMFKPLANNMGEALAELRTRSDVQWTYLSPAGTSLRTAKERANTSWAARSISSTIGAKAASAMPTTPSPWSTKSRTQTISGNAFPSSGSNALARKAAAGENPAVFFPFRGGAGGGTINRAESGSRAFLPPCARFSL